MQQEIWKDVIGYENLYQISNLGRVKSLERIVNRPNSPYKKKEKILSEHLNNGYLIVSLCKNSIRKSRTVHQLVAVEFLNHKPNGMNLVIDHINNIKTDNRVENLQIITQRENCSKEKRGNSKYTGIYFCKSTNKWKARIRINDKRKYLGYFINEIEASNAYQNELKKIKNEL